jgi:type III secretory pathway lipoprotein EscJ
VFIVGREDGMKVEEMALRSEIRQMLNEVGFTRETIKQLVKDSIDDIVRNQVNQVLMERKEKDLAEVVSEYIDVRLYKNISNCTERVIRDKLRWLDFKVTVQLEDKSKGGESC